MRTTIILAIAAFAASAHAGPLTFGKAVALVSSTQAKFGTFIEGAAVDTQGNAYAVNFGNATDRGTIGRITLGGYQTLVLADSSATASFNGVRFVCNNVFLAADVGNKRVVKVTLNDQGKIVSETTFCSDSNMLTGVPNDLTVDYAKKRVYVSGQAWTTNTAPSDGEIWMCTDGKATKQSDATSILGRTNGIELSLNKTQLYVSEAVNANGGPVSNKIVVFDLNTADGSVIKSSRRIFYDFATEGTGGIDIDGFRFDTQGNLYVTRNGGQKVTVLGPNGAVVGNIPLNIMYPTNLEIGGTDGRMLYAVGRCPGDVAYGTGVGCVDAARVPYPGTAITYLRSLNGKCNW